MAATIQMDHPVHAGMTVRMRHSGVRAETQLGGIAEIPKMLDTGSGICREKKDGIAIHRGKELRITRGGVLRAGRPQPATKDH